MNLLIFFAVLFATIVLAIVIQRIINCPILVGFAFFSIALLIAVILGDTTLVIFAVIIGVVAFLSAFLDCIFRRSGFFRNNNCLSCDSCNECNCNNNCNCDNSDNCDETFTIINSNGRVVARISGNSITTNNNNNSNNNVNGCGCNSRGYRIRR